MADQKSFYFTNNLMYDCHVIPYERAWVGGAWDHYPVGGVSELLWSAPTDSVQVNGVWEKFGYSYMTSFVAYNIEFKNKAILDNLDALYTWTKSVGAPNSMYFQPLVWTPDAPARGIILDTALARNPQAKIYNNASYPTWKAANNNYTTDPTFTDTRIKQKSDILAQWALPATKNDYFASYYTGGTAFTSLDWYWDPDGKMGQNETWPLFDGSYTNSAALTGGIDGLPIGDLNWFPAQKATYLKNEQAIQAHILALNTDKMDLYAAIKTLNKESVSIYPNPASKSFTISGADVDKISIYNAAGKLVKIQKSTSKNISVEGLDKGLYMVKIESKGVSKMKKLIVE
jgi:hypothetical protein